jgi:hypothetical protein
MSNCARVHQEGQGENVEFEQMRHFVPRSLIFWQGLVAVGELS